MNRTRRDMRYAVGKGLKDRRCTWFIRLIPHLVSSGWGMEGREMNHVNDRFLSRNSPSVRFRSSRVPLVTSLTLHSHPRSRGERSGSERSEKERNEPREMGCEGSMSVARCGGKDTKGRAATHHLLHSFRGPCPSLPPPLVPSPRLRLASGTSGWSEG